jgi:hypothetical protein
MALSRQLDTIINFLPPTQIARPLGKVGRFVFPASLNEFSTFSHAFLSQLRQNSL